MTCKYQDTGTFNFRFRHWRGTSKEKYLEHIKRLIVLLKINNLSEAQVNIHPFEEEEGIKFWLGYGECPVERYIHLINSFDDVVHLEINKSMIEDVNILSEIDSKNRIKILEIKEIKTRDDKRLDLSYLGSSKVLKELKVFGINTNYASIGKITSLERLILKSDIYLTNIKKHDDCTVIPDELGNLENLRHLELGMKCGHVSDNLGNLKRLETLHVSIHNLKEFPAFITELTNLKKLDIFCGFSYIPDISHLDKLEYLILSYNKLHSFPDVDKLPKSLKRLELDGNNIDRIPENISELKNLRYLSLKKNNITNFPAELSELEHLERLLLWYNDIKSLPEELSGSFSSLKILDLYENYIYTFPEWTVTLPETHTVYMEPRRRSSGWKYPERITRLAEDNGIVQMYIYLSDGHT